MNATTLGDVGVAGAAPARAPLVALVGNPNCGKTALFNLLTGSRQKIANYAGVTVERKEGSLATPAGRRVRVLDLPGAYSLRPRTPDERVTCDLVLGRLAGEAKPDLIVSVVDATNLRRHLRMVLPLKRLGHRVLVALNMTDLAKARGLRIDAAALARELGVPVVETVGIRTGGAQALVDHLDALARDPTMDAHAGLAEPGYRELLDAEGIAHDHAEVDRLLHRLGLDGVPHSTASDRIDRVVLHPVAGPLILALTLFLVFQAVFAWATPLMDGIDAAMGALAAGITALVPAGPLQSLLVDGVIAGAGGVLIFLPQIVLLFAFILVLEDSGYLPRAAFLLDRLMGGVGLSGRSFIPLLSSFACAIPGIMATRTIPNARDRIVTIMIAPLMTCSARLPVYALLIAAFVPAQKVWGGLVQLQGVVLFVLYAAGVFSAFLVAWVAKRFRMRGAIHPLQMELPTYHWPSLRNLRIGLVQRVEIFLRRVGGIILALMVILWFLSSYPAPPPGATGAPIEYSLAGQMGKALAVVFEPIGFNWQISIALVPGLAAREVAVGALGTVYALSAVDEAGTELAPLIAATWGLPTAFALLAWYVFAPQCLATLAVVKRETNSWRYPALMAVYLFGLAYVAAGITFHLSRWLMA